jgi:hypothetical protein
MHRIFVACLSSAVLVVGGAGVASAAASGAGPVSLSGSWEVQVHTVCKHCEAIRFDTSNGTFAEHDKKGFGDHGTYSLTGKTLTLHWTSGDDKGLHFAGGFKGAKNAFDGTYKDHHKSYKGDLAHKS